jgi:tRNA threonylcarbamoyladenosine biosynthesis protein TsaE
MEVITKNTQETQKLGEKMGRDLALGKIKTKILCLFGDLGSGKTTFIQGLAKGLGIKKRIISPTFIFIKQYDSLLYHIDLYRIENLQQAEGLGLEEIFSDPQAVVAIEWAEKIKKILPKKRIDLQFNYLNQKKRKIIIKSNFNSGQ